MKRLVTPLPIACALVVLMLAVSDIGARPTVAQGQAAAIARTQGQASRTAPAQGQVTTPEKFFGFQMGADRKMARWDKLVEYYQLLEKESGGKLKAINMGPTEMGNPLSLIHI